MRSGGHAGIGAMLTTVLAGATTVAFITGSGITSEVVEAFTTVSEALRAAR